MLLIGIWEGGDIRGGSHGFKGARLGISRHQQSKKGGLGNFG